MSGDLTPVAFRGGNDPDGSPVHHGFYEGQNFTGISVWVDLPNLLAILAYDIGTLGSVWADWTETLENIEVGTISEETVYLLNDCYFVAVEPVIPHWTDTSEGFRFPDLEQVAGS